LINSSRNSLVKRIKFCIDFLTQKVSKIEINTYIKLGVERINLTLTGADISVAGVEVKSVSSRRYSNHL
jgi:hypothetical protein